MKLSNKIITIFSITFLLLMVFVFLAVGLFPTVNRFGLFQPAVLMFGGAIALGLAVMYVAKRSSKLSEGTFKRFILPTIVFSAIFIVQLVYAHALMSDGYQWDADVVFTGAVHYVETGEHSDVINGYLLTGTNNSPLYVLLTSVFIAAKTVGITNYLGVATFLNVLSLFLAQLLVFATAKKLFGLRIAYIALGFAFVLIGLSMHVQSPYTDTLTVVFPILLFWLYLKLRESKKMVDGVLFYSLAIGATLAFGFMLKPTVIIAGIAIVIALLFEKIMKRRTIESEVTHKNKVLVGICAVLMFVLGAGLAYVGTSRWIDSYNVLPKSYLQGGSNETLPPVHFINIGMKEIVYDSFANYGGYQPDAAFIATHLHGSTAKTNYSLDGIKESLANYGVGGYLNFLQNKLRWILSDGTFYAYSEGNNDTAKLYANGPMSTFVQSFATYKGPYYWVWGNWLQIVWLTVLFLIAARFFVAFRRKDHKFDTPSLTLYLMITGIILFLLLFEGRARYLLLYVPIFIVAAMYALHWVRRRKS